MYLIEQVRLRAREVFLRPTVSCQAAEDRTLYIGVKLIHALFL